MTTIFYLVFAFIIILISWILYQRQQFKSFVTGAVLCTFVTASGSSYDKVLPVEGKWVMPPKGKWLKKKDTQKKWGKYILPVDTYTTSYPLGGWPDIMKVEVRRAFYYEDCPFPIVPEIVDEEEDEQGNKIKVIKKAHGKITNVTPQVLAALTNPEIAKTVLNPHGQIVQDITNPNKKADSRMNLIIIGIVIAIVAGLASCLLGYMIYSALQGHITAWGM